MGANNSHPFAMESVDTLNQRLIDHFGIDSDTGLPSFRIVWTNDQFEKRLVHHLDSGIELLYPIVRIVRKYPFFKNFWVLERLVVIPEINQSDLPEAKMSYEPIWVFRDINNKPLPPVWDASKIVIDVLYAALGKKSMRKYIEEDNAEERISKIQEELFGNETETSDALTYKEGIVVPSVYNRKDN